MSTGKEDQWSVPGGCCRRWPRYPPAFRQPIKLAPRNANRCRATLASDETLSVPAGIFAVFRSLPEVLPGVLDARVSWFAPEAVVPLCARAGAGTSHRALAP